MPSLIDKAENLSDARCKHGFARIRSWQERSACGALWSEFEAACAACPDPEVVQKAREALVKRMKKWQQH